LKDEDLLNELIRAVGYTDSELRCVDGTTTTLGNLLKAESVVRHKWDSAGPMIRGHAVATLRRSPYQDQRELAEEAEARLMQERSQRLALAYQTLGTPPLEAPSALVFWLAVSIFIVVVVGGLLWVGAMQ
jgi:hypothetical protein